MLAFILVQSAVIHLHNVFIIAVVCNYFGVTKVNRVHHLGTMKVCTKFYSNQQFNMCSIGNVAQDTKMTSGKGNLFSNRV